MAPDRGRQGERARKLEAVGIGERRLPAHRGMTNCMAVAERSWWRSALDATLNDRRDVAALLLGCGREPWHRVAVPTVGQSSVTNCENVRQPGDRQVFHDLHPTGPISFGL